MILTIVRHGIAIGRQAPDCPAEAERFLTAEGVSRTRQAMEGLKTMEVSPDAILSSPYVRAKQTAEIAALALGFDPGRIGVTDALLPGASPREIVEALAAGAGGSVLCCGHAPHVDHLVAFAVGAEEPFTLMKKAGAAALEIDPAYPGRGHLLWLASSRMLRMLGAAPRR